jgi:hypothetical protein
VVAFLTSFFSGNSYQSGKGVDGFLTKHFDRKKIRKYEIWTGTYNKDRQQAGLFCNRKEKDSILDLSNIDLELTQSMPPVYMSGDISKIATTGLASASIPSLVPPQKIEDENHVDGGIFGASPLTIMDGAILDQVNKNNDDLHINYINSVDLSQPIFLPNKNNMIDCWYQTASDLIRSQNIIDRKCAYNLLPFHKGKLHKDEFICNQENLARVEKIRAYVRYSLLEIYPVKLISVNMVDFNGDDVVEGIKTSFDCLSCHFWWIEPIEIRPIEVGLVQGLISDCCSSC